MVDSIFIYSSRHSPILNTHLSELNQVSLNPKNSFEVEKNYKRQFVGYVWKEEKRVELIGGSNLYITNIWLVDSLVAFAKHNLAPLPYQPFI
jgi:hypothetical protein